MTRSEFVASLWTSSTATYTIPLRGNNQWLTKRCHGKIAMYYDQNIRTCGFLEAVQV